MPRQILFIEDDDHIRAVLALSLEQEGYSVAQAGSGEDGLEYFKEFGADMVLVDLRLPNMDGFAVAREIRKRSNVPIAMVTASSDTYDVVAGLEAGADDYVVKPVVAKELAARVRALLRRANPVDQEDATVRLGDVVLYSGKGVVRKGGENVELTKTEFRILCELAERPGWVVSRAQLLERVWGYDFFGDMRLVEYHISRMRAKLEKDPSKPKLIVTVRGLGYKLSEDL